MLRLPLRRYQWRFFRCAAGRLRLYLRRPIFSGETISPMPAQPLLKEKPFRLCLRSLCFGRNRFAYSRTPLFSGVIAGERLSPNCMPAIGWKKDFSEKESHIPNGRLISPKKEAAFLTENLFLRKPGRADLWKKELSVKSGRPFTGKNLFKQYLLKPENQNPMTAGNFMIKKFPLFIKIS